MRLQRWCFLIVILGVAFADRHTYMQGVDVDRHVVYLTPHTHTSDQITVSNKGQHITTLQARLYRVDHPGSTQATREEVFSLIDADVRMGAKQFTLPAKSVKTIPLHLVNSHTVIPGLYQLELSPPQAKPIVSANKRVDGAVLPNEVINIVLQPDKPALQIVSEHVAGGIKIHNHSNVAVLIEAPKLCTKQRCVPVARLDGAMLFPGQSLQLATNAPQVRFHANQIWGGAHGKRLEKKLVV